MAEPIQRNRVPRLQPIKDIPMLKVDEVPYFSPPKGLDLTSRLSRVGHEFAADIQNIVLDDGSLVSRAGTEAQGGIASDVMAIIGITSPSGSGYLFRTTTTALERWTGAGWDSIITGFTGSTNDYFSFSTFGSQLLVANGVDKLHFYDMNTGENGEIEESVPSKHVTTFNGRVVLSHTIEGESKPYRIRWSVKNNSLDWDSDGSGWEDLFATPGGAVDACHGVFPITDDTALVVRENSVWIMSVTGNLLAPHRFSRLFGDIGTSQRRAIAMIPGGIVMPTRDNIVAMTTSDIRRIGEQVKYGILDSIDDDDAVVAKYDVKRNEYRLAVNETVWRYNFRDAGWTKDVYPFFVRDMARVTIDRIGIPMDSLPILAPTIDGLTGIAIDDLSLPGSFDTFFFVGY